MNAHLMKQLRIAESMSRRTSNCRELASDMFRILLRITECT